MTYCVWAKIPSTNGWSRVAGDLTKEFAEQMSDALFFESRAMPDRQAPENDER